MTHSDPRQELIDGVTYVVNTNAWRSAKRVSELRAHRNAACRRAEARGHLSNLQQIGRPAAIEDVAQSILEDAFGEVEQRLIAISEDERPLNAKRRRKIRWLSRWSMRISAELERRQRAKVKT